MDMITALRRERGKIRVTINGDTELAVSQALFRERPLAEGESIDLAEYDQWLMVRQYRPALDRAVGLLASRARSRREIEERLLHAGYRACTVEMVLYKLEKEHLLNDADFARQWVEARSTRALGQRRIAQELRRKGVSSQEAEDALSLIRPEDQLAGAIELARKGLSRAKPDEDPRKTVSRVASQLARRGYSWDIARKAIEQAMEDTEE